MLGLLSLLAFGLALLIALLSAMLVREMRRPPRHTTAYAIKRGMAADPADLNLSHEEWTLERPDGARLPVWDIQGQGESVDDAYSSGSKPLTAVFIHGWGHSRIDALARIRSFLPMFDRLVLYDLRGHGDSTGALSNLGHGEHLDLLALLERLGDERFVLIGHSIGAVIAMHAARHRSRDGAIVGVIAYAPYCEFHESLQGRLRVAGYPRRPITDLALLALRLLGIQPCNLTETDVAEVKCPLLIIHGADDVVAPIAHGRRLSSCHPNAILHEIPGANHTDAHVLDAESHDAIVREFIWSLRSQAVAAMHKAEA